ncbi:MAG: peptidoglycan-binding domain-containing protein, partial [Pseudomonadota bacterium]
EDRIFVLPAGFTLDRATDLFTRAVPLSAFGRAAAVSGNGGAVFAKPRAGAYDLSESLSRVTEAPEPIAGGAPIVLETSEAKDPMIATLATFQDAEVIELGQIIRRMAVAPEVTISKEPDFPVILREPDRTPEPEALSGEIANTDAASLPKVEENVPVDILVAFEQSMSRSLKRTLQRGLKNSGAYKGLIDGIFGPQTRAAITAYQSTRGVEQTGYLTQSQIVELRREAG